MNTQSLQSVLDNSSDPLMLIDGQGAMIWGNLALRRLVEGNKPINPSDLVSKDDVTAILKTTHYGSVEVTLQAGALGKIEQTAVVIDVAAGDLDDQLFLIAFKSTGAETSVVKEKEHWLTSVAHDLKNPLSAIFGYSDTLLDTKLGEGLNRQQREIIGRIRGTSARATDLVRNYQHLSQLALRGVAQSSCVIDLNAAIQDVVNTTWREDPNNPRVATIMDGTALPARIERLHLERIIANLFNNAVKFSPAEGVVTITSGRGSNGPWFSVHNYGPGIKPDEQDKLFKPFSRLSSSAGKPGTGLGLAIVKQIIDGTGSSISVTSNNEGGTTFTVRLVS